MIGPGDQDLPGLQWLAQRIEHLGLELRQFVEEEHALVLLMPLLSQYGMIIKFLQ
jgi:hypothetical protein